jgi:hypothetical protein
LVCAVQSYTSIWRIPGVPSSMRRRRGVVYEKYFIIKSKSDQWSLASPHASWKGRWRKPLSGTIAGANKLITRPRVGTKVARTGQSGTSWYGVWLHLLYRKRRRT